MYVAAKSSFLGSFSYAVRFLGRHTYCDNSHCMKGIKMFLTQKNVNLSLLEQRFLSYARKIFHTQYIIEKQSNDYFVSEGSQSENLPYIGANGNMHHIIATTCQVIKENLKNNKKNIH